MNELAEHELRSRFTQLRSADLGDVPSFRAVVDRARPLPVPADRGERRWPRRLAVPIALAAALVLAGGIARVSRRREFIAPPLSTWTSPTAALLRTSGVGLLEAPHVLTSALGPALQPALSRGTKR